MLSILARYCLGLTEEPLLILPMVSSTLLELVTTVRAMHVVGGKVRKVKVCHEAELRSFARALTANE